MSGSLTTAGLIQCSQNHFLFAIERNHLAERIVFPPQQDQVTNKLEPVVFFLNVSLNEAAAEPQQALQDLDMFPMLSGQQQLTEKTEVLIY